MSTQIEVQRSSVVPTVLAGSGPVPVPELVPGLALRVIVADFELGIDASIREVHRRLEGTAEDIYLRVAIAENVDANIVLSGKDREDGGFDTRQLSFLVLPTEQHAEVAFVASTLSAALKLSCKVALQIPDIDLALTLTAFDSPLLEAGKLLRERQTTYRLMTIERATGINFGPVPSTLSGDDVGTINFIYHAVIDRTFTDGLRDIEVLVKSNEEGLEMFNKLKVSAPLTFPHPTISKSLLGRSVLLGPQTVTVADPYIENLDRAQEELARRDGHQVRIVVRSRTNRAQYSLPDAPRLPPAPWEPGIQKLIDLETQLDSALVDRYNTLAAQSLAGLTEEEKELVTQPSEISYPF